MTHGMCSLSRTRIGQPVFARTGEGVAFVPGPPLADLDVAEVLAGPRCGPARSRALPGPPRPVAATISPRVITTSSLTKAYGLAGLRCGRALADTDTREEIRRVRDLVDGTVAFPRVRGRDLANDLADRLLRDYGTAVVPGRFFEASEHFRVALGFPGDVLDRRLDAISRALRGEAGMPS